MSVAALVAATLIAAGITLVFLDLYGINRTAQMQRLKVQADLAYRLVERARSSQAARNQLTEDLAMLDAALASHGHLIDTPRVPWRLQIESMLAGRAGDSVAVASQILPTGQVGLGPASPSSAEPHLVSVGGWDAATRLISTPLIDGTTGTLIVAIPTEQWQDALSNPKVRQHLLLTAILLILLLVGAFGLLDVLKRQVRRLYRQANTDFEPLPMSTGAGSTTDEMVLLATRLDHLKRELSVRDAQIHELAFHDALTTLPNRQHFVNRIESMLEDIRGRPELADQAIVVVVLNLNHFRRVNDTLGHETGDSVLRLVAQRLKHLRPEDSPARVDGNEFAAAFLTDEADALSSAQRYTAAIRASLEAPIRLNGTDIDIRVTAGIAFSSLQNDSANDLIRRAYISLSSARDAMQEHAVFEPGMDNGEPLDLSLLGQLRAAIRKNELVLHYQPKVALRTGRTNGAEALARWAHPTRGLLSPGSFIEFAETNGFITHITRWSLNQAFADFNELEGGRADFCLSVNVSAHDILDRALPDYLEHLAQTHKVRRDGIVLEITETAVMHSLQQCSEALHRIREFGFRLSIDDFGTGYSSLAYIGELPANEIKIDRSFVVSMQHSSERGAILRAAIEIGRNLDLDVVAEGIETAEAAERLKDWGCTTGQGYFFAKPLPKQEFLHWDKALLLRVAPASVPDAVRSATGPTTCIDVVVTESPPELALHLMPAMGLEP